MKLALLLIVSYIAVDICCSLLWPLPNSKRVQACYDSVRNENVDDFIGSQKVWHCQHLYKNMSVPSELTEEDNERKKYLDSLIEGMFGSTADTRRKRQINTTPCRRKELRMLSLEERSRLFAAMNNLKTDTSVRPNKYDAIALIHTGEMNLVAHNGAGFLGWHILFLLIFEAALRQVDRSVCLPYWDSTLDSMLPNPTLSELWSPEFMGTPRGAVVQGPFANWRLPRGESLSRDVDLDGELMTPTNVRNILSRSRYEEIITSPTTSTRYDIEFIHGGPHVFVGGTMSSLDTAAFEPMFFFHHSYINYIYVRFRSRLRSLGRNPAVYPRILGADFRHAPNYPTGLGSYTQADGYADYFERLSVYEPVPTCSSISPSCGNRFLTCQNGLCLPRLTSGRSKRSISIPGLVDPIEVTNILSQGSTRSNTCDTPDAYITPYNDFCVDGACDTSLWAGVSYKIIAARRPNSPVFRNFPVIKGRVDVSRDIYEPSAYDETKRFIADEEGNPMAYSRCQNGSAANQIYVYSRGINYEGHYKESAVIDPRQAVAVTVGVVFVKRPNEGETVMATVGAHTVCGQVCRIACQDLASGDLKRCSGAIALSSRKPFMYGYNYDDSLMSMFGYRLNNRYPKLLSDNFFFTLYCDYPKQFPYSN